MRLLSPRPGSTLAAFGDMAGFLFGATAMFAAMYETQAILPTVGRDFGVTPSQAGLTVSLPVISVAVAAWLWGNVSDRIGRRRSLILSSSLLALPTLLGAFAPSFGTFLACRIAQGICMPGLLIVGVPFVIETYAPKYGGRVMGYYICSLVAGGLLGRVGVAMVASVSTWRWAVALLTILPVASAVVLIRTLPAETSRPARGVNAGVGRLLALTRNPVLVSATLTGCGTFFAFIAIYTYAAYRLEGAPFNLSATGVGFVFLLWLLGALAPTVGKLSERRGWRKVAATAMVLGAIGVGLSFTSSLPIVVAGLGLVIFAAFSGQTAAALGQGTSTDTDKGLASAMYFSAYYTAGSIAGYLPGLAWEAYGWGGVASTALGGYVFGLAAVMLGAVGVRRRAGVGGTLRGPISLTAERPDPEEAA